MKIINGHVFDLEHGFVSRELYTNGSVISSASSDSEFVYDAKDCYVIPGLVDLHFHGCCGEDFSDASAAGLQKIADYQLSNGVTYICPAGMTLPKEALIQICKTAATHHKDATTGAELVGINLEGPFLSDAKKGAQNGAYLQGPDLSLLQELQNTSGELVKLVTVAPELPGALEFIHNAKDVTISIGHTAANYDEALAGFQAGAKQATHLYNGMIPMHHRNPGVIGAAFDSPNAKVELICDGIHIHPSMIRLTFQIFGNDRVILISDSIRATGMPDGQYTLGGQDVLVRGNRATLVDSPDTLAGSATNLMDCMRTAVSFGIPLEDAVRAATFNPAQALKLEDRIGTLDSGKDATFILLNKEDLSIKDIIFHGTFISK